MTTSTSDRLKALLAEHLGVPAEKVTDDALLMEDLGADSLDALEIGMVIEDAFDIPFDGDDIKPIWRVRDLVEAVDKERGRTHSC